jgi:two-component system NtrC family sensor kinase
LKATGLKMPTSDLLPGLVASLVDLVDCDAAELDLQWGDRPEVHFAVRGAKGAVRSGARPAGRRRGAEGASVIDPSHYFPDPAGCAGVSRFTEMGSFWTGAAEYRLGAGGREGAENGPYRSVAAIFLPGQERAVGLLTLLSRRPDAFTEGQVRGLEGVAGMLGMAVASHGVQAAFRERVKELACLYGIAQIAERPGASLEQILRGTVGLLPHAWQYPEVTAARITLDGHRYATQGFSRGRPTQSAEIVIGGEPRGTVEVSYAEDRPDADEGPFLKEERNLIDAVARNLALVVERRLAAEEQLRLQEQLMHADRLATVGQLAAGVAHELNEPLGSILGFAQLVQKDTELPAQARRDVDRIVDLSLHAREVIRMLLLFARQARPSRSWVNLNRVVEEGLYFFQARCAKSGIELVRSLAPDLPDLFADPTQLNQVVVNLVVNAVQAMPAGGRLMVGTRQDQDAVVLVVEDTGIGMSEQTMEQILLPFFTTKDVGQGTGLGLPVAHGIVTAHGGTITVESRLGRGTRFEVRLPVSGSGVQEAEAGDVAHA